MRPKLEQIQYIEDYISGRLDETERKIFEKKLITDKQFAHDVELQKLVMKRIKTTATKQAIEDAHKRFLKKNGGLRNKFFRTGGLILLFLAILGGTIYWLYNSSENLPDNKNESFINPPIPGADVPKTTYLVNADSGQVITHSSGSVIYIPKQAFLDEQGNIVTGNVELDYREFNDPIDFYLAGIPMEVEVDGKSYVMESAAMCEINASRYGKPLQVNPANKITIFQAASTSSNAFDLYYLDTIARQWKVKGKDVPLNLMQNNVPSLLGPEETSSIPKPVKPRRADPERYSFTIDFDAEKLPELAGFRDVIFEIHEDEKGYNPADGDVVWEKVEIERGKEAGTYLVTFSKGKAYLVTYSNSMSKSQWKDTVISDYGDKKRSVEYLTRPVFEGKSYEEAMSLYEQKLAAYQRQRRNRLRKESGEHMAIIRFNQRVDSMNAALEARNQAIISKNRVVDSLNALTENQDESVEFTYRFNEVRKPNPMNYLNTELNYKRAELLSSKALTPAQANDISKISRDNLYTHEKFINTLYEANEDYLKVWKEVSALLQSSQITQAEKDRLNAMSKTELLNSSETINQRFFMLTSQDGNRFRDRIFREFEIDGFGIWNCDVLSRPMLTSRKIKAEFYDTYADMNLSQVMLVDGTRNSLVRVNRVMFQHFSWDPEHKNIVWTVTPDHNRLIYFNQFNAIPDTSVYTFPMEIIQLEQGKYDNYAVFRNLLKGLME